MSAAIISRYPFSDANVEPTVLYETNSIDFKACDPATLARKSYIKTASRPDNVAVPMLDPLSPGLTSSPQSSVSTPSNASTTPTSLDTDTFDVPMQWNNADLMYLLSCILPEDLITNHLVFSPPLEQLDTYHYPIQLQLFKTLPITLPPHEAYSKHAPIGTGRPCSKLLLVESDKASLTPADARRSLARNLLSDKRVVAAVVDKYNVLFALYTLPSATLYSVQRCLFLMSYITVQEWNSRLSQLRGIVNGENVGDVVDGTCDVEPRLEIFFLGVGRMELEGWTRRVNVAVRVRERDRRVWAEVYGDAATFMGRAAEELFR